VSAAFAVLALWLVSSAEPVTIGRLAERLDLNPRTIRYYERIGLLAEPERTESGYRLYQEEDAERVRFIKAAQRLGLTLGEIGEILAFRDRGEPPCRYVAHRVAERLTEVDQRIRDLRTLKGELKNLHQRMKAQGALEGADGSYCHFIQAPPDHGA
jgi:DNA-binding transcriptional MerR regulator